MAKRPVEPEAPESLHEVWLINLQVLYTKHQNKIAVALLLAALFFIGRWAYTDYQIRQLEDSWGRMATATSPVSFRNIAEDYAGQTVANHASLSAADLLLSEATRVRTAESDEVDVESNLQQAEGLYQEVLSSSEHDLIKANALFGLAAIAECRLAWDDAQGHYETIERLAAERYPFLASMAAERSAVIPELQKGVVIEETSILDELGVGGEEAPESEAAEAAKPVSEEAETAEPVAE
ncbi:hypothetical protein [Mucisphaera calidilacus]|uniref:Tetratricopeptide repeat-like domain-containing protein n=1 Tax=Mucisphaera calidilacus TaxID=2527982 RepID=A0A518BXN6_9BACT|nr:hypothetical protein [Mucisphaera calidilacus]QDU71716.1 hypothetical protein Pan265_15690 [Mucisphaera calidilacus]